jgi:hypothetical protein
MNFKIVKIGNLSGGYASVYSILLPDEGITLFDRFVKENKDSFISELKDIYNRLSTIGHTTGARVQFFKMNEGAPGDGICALYDNPDSKLRLYCIRYDSSVIILGGGGHKPKTIRALQEDSKLKEENYLLRKISNVITQRIKDAEICISDGEIEGDLEFNEEDYE